MNIRICFFFCMSATEDRSREAVESCSSEILKSHLDMVLAGPPWPCLNREMGPGLLWRSLPASTKARVILSQTLFLFIEETRYLK